MRPVSTQFPINQPFGSMATAGVAPSNVPDTVGYYVNLYGNYQPFGHAGCDIACPEGTPVYAIASGTVLWADWGTNLPGDDSEWGYRQRWYLYKSFPGIATVIQHDGWIGVYAHKSEAWMNAGDRVAEGQQIGLSGGTGGVAPHLHVEALVDLNYPTGGGLIYGRTNPEPYFGSAAIAAQSTTTATPPTQQPSEEDELSAALDTVNMIRDRQLENHLVTQAKLDGNHKLTQDKLDSNHLIIQRRLDTFAAEIAGLRGALAAATTNPGITPEALTAAFKDAVGEFSITLTAGK